MTTNACGSTVPCAAFYSQNPFVIALTTVNTYPFTIKTGFNQLLLTQPIYVSQGSFLVLTQTTGKVAIDTSGTAAYSDMYLLNNAYYNLSLTSKQRFYINYTSNFSTYQSSFVVNHTYLNPGLYPLTFTLASTNSIWQYTALITQCI